MKTGTGLPHDHSESQSGCDKNTPPGSPVTASQRSSQYQYLRFLRGGRQQLSNRHAGHRSASMTSHRTQAFVSMISLISSDLAQLDCAATSIHNQRPFCSPRAPRSRCPYPCRLCAATSLSPPGRSRRRSGGREPAPVLCTSCLSGSVRASSSITAIPWWPRWHRCGLTDDERRAVYPEYTRTRFACRHRPGRRERRCGGRCCESWLSPAFRISVSTVWRELLKR